MTKTLITGGWVVSMDPAIGTLSGGDLLIDGDRIVDVGVNIDAGDARVIDAAGMIVMPGLVNAHLHSWQTGIRGISADWSLSQYFARMHRGMAASFTPDDIYLGTLVGALNQLNGGGTTLFDWLAGKMQKLADSGRRLVAGTEPD